MLRSIFFFLLAIHCLESQAKEGFFSLDTLQRNSIEQAFMEFPVGHDCGSVRIHSEKPYYLSALHCFRKVLSEKSVMTIGSPMNYELLVYYDDLAGKTVNIDSFKARIVTKPGFVYQ